MLTKLEELREQVKKLETLEKIKDALSNGTLALLFSEETRDRAYSPDRTFSVRFATKERNGALKEVLADFSLETSDKDRFMFFVESLLDVKE